jgi:hypothetical protein
VTYLEFATELFHCQSQGLEFMLFKQRRRKAPRGEMVRLAPGLSGRFVGAVRLPDGWVNVLVDVRLRVVQAWLARNSLHIELPSPAPARAEDGGDRE